MKLSKLIEEHLFQISLLTFFVSFSVLVPFSRENALPNFHFGLLNLRCLFINLLTALALKFTSKAEFEILIFPVAGIVSSLAYLKTGTFWIMIFCVPLTITSITIVALIAFSSIRVKF